MSTLPTLHVIYAPDEPKDRMDISFLQTGLAPLSPAPTPTDANAQDILIALPDDTVCLVTFDKTDPDLVARVAQECDALYTLFSGEGIICFRTALFIPGGLPFLRPGIRALASDAAAKYLSSHPPLRGEKPNNLLNSYYDPATNPVLSALLEACYKREDELVKIAKTLVEQFEKKAQIQADREIQRTIDDLFHEAGRYFGLKAFPPTPEQPTDAPPPMVRGDAALAGKELAGLAAALTRIHKAFTAFEQAQAEYSAKWPPGSPSGGTPLPEETVRQQLAAQGLQQKRDALGPTVIEACRVYPILYRLWDSPIRSSVAAIWDGEAPESGRLDVLKRNETVRVWLIDLINKISEAAGEFQAAFRQDASLIWKYNRVVSATLQTLGLTPGDLAYRVVKDKLWSTQESHETWTSLLSTLSEFASDLDLLLGLIGVSAPPVALLATALFGVETIVKIVTEAEKDAAFNACLDPGKSLVSEPGSFGSALIDGLFLLLALKHLPGQIRLL